MTAQARPDEDAPEDGLVVHLTPLRRRHLRAVLRIEAQVYPRPWTMSLFLSELTLRSSRSYFVARVDGVVVGYAGLMVAGEDAHVTTIAVDPAWQRRKIATRLLLTLTGEAVRRQASNLTLEVRMGNRGAQELYRRFGFRPAGVRRNYYMETREDALVMWATDVDSAEYGERLRAIEADVPGVTLLESPRLR